MLEPYDGKLSRTVLRGAGAGNGPGLPGVRHEVAYSNVMTRSYRTWKSPGMSLPVP